MESHAQILKHFGTTELANALKVQPRTVTAWKARNRIPPEYWVDFSDYSHRSRRPITVERLALAAKEWRNDE
jgi:hypothetical protein